MIATEVRASIPSNIFDRIPPEIYLAIQEIFSEIPPNIYSKDAISGEAHSNSEILSEILPGFF